MLSKELSDVFGTEGIDMQCVDGVTDGFEHEYGIEGMGGMEYENRSD